MADKRIRRLVTAVFDKRSHDQANDELVQSLSKAGEKGGTNFAREMRAAYNKRIAQLREELAAGTIDQKEFKRQSEIAARSFNEAFLKSIRQARAEGKLTDAEFIKLTRSLKRVGDEGGSAWDRIKKGIAAAGLALASFFALNKLQAFLRDSVMLAARFETLGVVLRRVGENAGYTAAQTEAAAKALQKSGISMIESRQSAARLISANIDLAHATDLARVAQDAAVIGNINSSEAFERLVRGIASAEVETLRNIGLNVNFQRSYERLARQLGVSTGALTEIQKAQARTNEVLRVGAGIAGSYTDAMDTAGKMMGSTDRLAEDLRIKIGQLFAPAFRELVEQYTEALKGANDAMDRFGDSGGVERVGRLFQGLIGTVVGFGRIIHNVFQEASDLLHGMVATVMLALTSIVNEATKAVNLLLGLASRIPGVELGQLPTADAAVAAWAAEQEKATENFRRNAAEIGEAVRAIADAWAKVEETAREAGAAVSSEVEEATKDVVKAMHEEVALLVEAARLRILSGDEVLRLLDLEEQLAERLVRGNLSLKERIDLQKSLNALAPFGLSGLEPQIATRGTTPPAGQLARHGTGTGARKGMAILPNMQKIILPKVEGMDEYKRVMENVGSIAEQAAFEMSSAFQDAFDRMREEGVTLGNFMEALGRGIGGALLAGLAQAAQGKAAENFALAIEAGAKALLFKDPSAGASVPAFLAAATAWTALAGLAGSARGAVTGGRGGIPPSTRLSGITAAERSERAGAEVNIYLSGEFDMLNPQVQRTFAGIVERARERFGEGSKITVRPKPGGGG